MKSFLPLFTLLFAATALAEEEGFVPLFNGRDLSGWVNVNCALETWSVREGVIACTGRPTGALRLPKKYENFILELEWRHLQSGGNAGVFVWASPIAAPGVPFLRAIEVQVLDHGYGNTDSYTTHGDVFPIHGSTMVPFGRHRGMRSFPSESRSNPSPEWNHYRVEANDGVLRLSVNGKEVSGGEKCVWRKGYLGLESEGAPTEWRNLRIKELPSTGAKPEDSAPDAQGHRPLYNGLDLSGWKTATPERWQPADWKLVLQAGAAGEPLVTEAEFGDCEIVIDCRAVAKDGASQELRLRGAKIRLALANDKWTRFTLQVRGARITYADAAGAPVVIALPEGAPARSALGISDSGVAAEFANLYVRDL